MINIILAGVLQAFSGERAYGTYSILLASRGSRFQAFFSRSVLHYPNGVLNISVSLLWAYLVLGYGLGTQLRIGYAKGLTGKALIDGQWYFVASTAY